MPIDSVDKYKMIFGLALLFMLTCLAAIIGLGHVEEKTSYGLQIILGSLATLSGGFATWAFSKTSDDKKG